MTATTVNRHDAEAERHRAKLAFTSGLLRLVSGATYRVSAIFPVEMHGNATDLQPFSMATASELR